MSKGSISQAINEGVESFEAANSDMEIQYILPRQLSSFVLVWLGPIDDQLKTFLLGRLSGIITSIESFDRPSLCIRYLVDVKDKVILILSTPQAKHVVAVVDDLPHIFYIYMFSTDSEIVDLKWMNDYSKLHGLYSDMNSLLIKISDDMQMLSDKSEKVARSATSSTGTSSMVIYSNERNSSFKEDFNENDNEFILFQIFSNVLLSSDLRTDRDMAKAVQMCRQIYKDKPIELTHIDEFEEYYTPNYAVHFYTRFNFLYRLLSKAFRLFDITILLTFRWFIIDLYTQLNQLYHERTQHLQQGLTVYRGKVLRANDFAYLKNNVGCLISMKGFLSTTLSCAIASIFSGVGQCSPEFESVIFEIRIDPNINEAKPFAPTRHLSFHPDEEEVIFSVGYVFRIESIEQMQECVWLVRLISSNEAQQSVKNVLHQFENDLGATVNYITFGNALSKLNKLDQAKIYYRWLLEMLPSTHTDIAQTYNNLGMLYSGSGDYSLALEYYYQSLNFVNVIDETSTVLANELKNTTPDNPKELILPGLDRFSNVLSQIHYNMGCVHQTMHDYGSALESFQEACALTISGENESLNLASIYSHMGSIYYNQCDFNLALSYFEKALDISVKLLPSNHPRITASLNNIRLLRQQHFTKDSLASTEKQLQTLSTEDTNYASSS